MNDKIIGKNIFIDMDGVIADFNAEKNAVFRFNKEQGFFKSLRPILHNLQAVKIMIKNGENVKILSASPNEIADQDKHFWLDKYLPELKPENRIIVRNSDNKADFMGDIRNCVLFDDYSGNLIPVLFKGGLAIKVVGVNDNKIGTHTKYGINYVNSLMELLWESFLMVYADFRVYNQV